MAERKLKKPSLAETHPELAQEWHPTKNGDLTPRDVTAGSKNVVWWYLPYDDSTTGKHFDFEWETSIQNRTRKSHGCPYLSGHAVYAGFNDLATTNPELAAQWHPTKNNALTPRDVTGGSEKTVWWYLPYDDPKTGKHHNFEWTATINNRRKYPECPYLTGKRAWRDFNDLATTHPELTSQWHPFKNGELQPTQVTIGSSQKVWWFFPYDDPKTGKHFDFEWETAIKNRNKRPGCPFLTNQAVWVGYNDLLTTHPHIAKEWHPSKNKGLCPTDVSAGSDKRVWWYLPYDDPVTGKHFNFEWQATIKGRAGGNVCPYLSGHDVWQGFNDLVTTHPALSREWHPTKNEALLPQHCSAGSCRKVWWLLPYDDPVTGKHFDFEWQAAIQNRTKGHECPYLTGNMIYPGFNDLLTTHPAIAAQWHPTKNATLSPSHVTAGSGRKVWWQMHVYDESRNEYVEYEWEASIASRTLNGNGCPYLHDTKTPYLVKQCLRNSLIKYTSEYRLDECRNQHPLSFDIFLTAHNLLIECDGEQHFRPLRHFGGLSKFTVRIQNDNIKNAYCRDNNIPLLRIPYIYDPVKDKEKIEQLVLEFIETQQVPQEIIDFYAQFEFSTYCKQQRVSQNVHNMNTHPVLDGCLLLAH